MSILDEIKTYKLVEIAERKARRPQSEIDAAARAAGPVRAFRKALQSAQNESYGLIAEVKKASPSRGLIRADFDAAAIARAYAAGGATCLSVLTDAPSFQGHEDYLAEARAACELPVLRKDFLYDPWQVAEARAIGADCILVILATVDDAQAAELMASAADWGMDALVEVHDEDELDRAQKLDAGLIGINNRDLRTFDTSLDVTKRLVRLTEPERMTVSESGLSTPADLAEIARYGCRGFLIGESLMRQDDVADATRALLAAPLTAGGR